MMFSARLTVLLVLGSLLGGMLLFSTVGGGFRLFQHYLVGQSMCDNARAQNYGFPYSFASGDSCYRGFVIREIHATPLIVDFLLYSLLSAWLIFKRAYSIFSDYSEWHERATRWNGPETSFFPWPLNKRLAIGTLLVGLPFIALIMLGGGDGGLGLGILFSFLLIGVSCAQAFFLGLLSSKPLFNKIVNFVLWEIFWFGILIIMIFRGEFSSQQEFSLQPILSYIGILFVIFLIGHAWEYYSRWLGMEQMES